MKNWLKNDLWDLEKKSKLSVLSVTLHFWLCHAGFFEHMTLARLTKTRLYNLKLFLVNLNCNCTLNILFKAVYKNIINLNFLGMDGCQSQN